MINITVDQKSIAEMKRNLGVLGDHLPRHLATAVNRVGKTVRVEVAQQLNPLINLKLHSKNKANSKPIKKSVTLKKTIKQKNRATPDKPSIVIGLWEGYPFPLKYFEAKPYTKTRKKKKLYVGVQYKTDMGGGWTTVSDGFIAPRFNGHVYKRANENRGPLVQLKGKKPGDFFREGNIDSIATAKAKERLPIEVNRRLREIILAASGQIKLKASKGLGA